MLSIEKLWGQYLLRQCNAQAYWVTYFQSAIGDENLTREKYIFVDLKVPCGQIGKRRIENNAFWQGACERNVICTVPSAWNAHVVMNLHMNIFLVAKTADSACVKYFCLHIESRFTLWSQRGKGKNTTIVQGWSIVTQLQCCWMVCAVWSTGPHVWTVCQLGCEVLRQSTLMTLVVLLLCAVQNASW